MMYSMEKCLGRNGTGTTEEAGIFTGGGEGLGQEGAPSDDVVLVSAVAAVSHEIGDILKDELGDAERADRIGAELADLSAELGLLAGLHDGDSQQDFPTLLKLAMGNRQCESSGSTSSSSSWSRARGGVRRASRPTRVPRRRPIAKGKEVSRRRSVAARRAASVRVRRAEAVSDVSDVGADSDSDDQWTELDDNSISGSGSGSSTSSDDSSKSGEDALHQYQAGALEPPQMRQFLLPLISNVPNSVQFRIRHEDILQLLATEEDDKFVPDLPAIGKAFPKSEPEEFEDMYAFEEGPVTPEEEATLLHYVCGGERGSMATFVPVEDWLLGVFQSWCEVSSLIYTLIGTDASAHRVCGPWAYRVRLSCHCHLCISSLLAEPALACLLRDLVWALAHGGSTVPYAAHLMRALRLGGDVPLTPEDWDLPRLKRIRFTDEGAAIINDQLRRYSQQNATARDIITTVCCCRVYDKPLEKQYAVERLIKILESFKSAANINFKIDMLPLDEDPETNAWLVEARVKLERYLQPFQDTSSATRLHIMFTKSKPPNMHTWDDFDRSCHCTSPKIMCAPQRKKLLRSIYERMSFFGLKHTPADCETSALPDRPTPAASQKPKKPVKPAVASSELQQGDGTGAKPPDSAKGESCAGASNDAPESDSENEQSDPNADDSSFLTVTDSDENSGASLGLSTSSMDSASELLLAAAHAVHSDNDPAPTQLCRTVRHLMRSIASIERHMDTVLKQCDEWPTGGNDVEARKQVDLGLSEVDRKLMAMYRRLPEVHRRQLQVYRKQKKLSTVCMQLVGGAAPPPPPPGSPPPAAHRLPCRSPCPEYHLQRFKEVRRKVMHMRDQQLYYHRLRMWLEDQLRRERQRIQDSHKTSLPDDAARRRRRCNSPKLPRLSTATKRKLKPSTLRILQLLKHKAETTQLLKDIKKDEATEAAPPEAFPLEREENISDTDTIVGEKEVDMNQVLATLAQMAVSPDKRIQKAFADLREEYANTKTTLTSSEEEFPESVSPPLQEMSPTTEPPPAFIPTPTQRILNKINENIDFNAQTTPEINVPLNARRSPVKENKVAGNAAYKDPNIYKYVTFGLEIKKAMEECQDIINSYNIKSDKGEQYGSLSLEQICEVMMSLDKNSAEFLDKIGDDNALDIKTNAKLAELVESMPQILANMPEIASEFANASFELPEFASIMNNLPDVNSETQLTPETLKQIRELKLSKSRDSVKVTKNTAKRKISRKVKNNASDVMTFEFDSKDASELTPDDKELQELIKCKTSNVEDFKNILFSISSQVVINKVFEYLRATKSPELAKCLNDRWFALETKSCTESGFYLKAAALFDIFVKKAHSMGQLMESVRARFNTWRHYVYSEFKTIPIWLIDSEIEAMLDKFKHYIQNIASKQIQNDMDRIINSIEDCRNEECDSEGDYTPSKESIKQLTKILSVSAENTFDLLLMKMSRMTGERRSALNNMRFKYPDILKRCGESQQLVGWILSDPDLAASHIQDLMGFVMKSNEKTPDFITMPIEKKRAYFMDRLKALNRHYMSLLPKNVMTCDEWLVMLYRLVQFEDRIKDALVKFSPPVKTTQNASEAEILAAKGLSKIIGNANNVRVKKAETSQPVTPPVSTPVPLPAPSVSTAPSSTPPVPAPASLPATSPAPAPTKPKEPTPAKAKPAAPKASTKPAPKCTKTRREVILKCEELIAQKGNKPLKDSFDAIKSFLAGEVSIPQNYHDHVMSIVSNLDYSALDDEIVEVLQFGGITISPPTTKDANSNSGIEELAKFSAQALRNAVAFKNFSRNGQSKSESDIPSCDVPSSECKYTSDCICTACKRDRSMCLRDIVEVAGLPFDGTLPEKSKNVLEDRRRDGKDAKAKAPAKAKPLPKQCENATHQQHVCKVGHTSNGNGSCTGDGSEQHCTCCYCTVFGHAPPLTTPVPKNFNETRERLRHILNKKKHLCKTANGELNPPDSRSPQQEKKATSSQPAPVDAQPKPPLKTVQPQPKPPALPKTLPPNLTAQAQAKRLAMDNQQRMLADKMAKMVVTEKPDGKPMTLQRLVPVNAPSLKAEGKVNPNAMEQIRLQQIKQQQQACFQQQLLQQKKPEPIYDLPIHNKPLQQQQLIRQELQKQQLQKQLQLQQKLKQHQVLHINTQPQHATQQQTQQKPTPQLTQQTTTQPTNPTQQQQNPTLPQMTAQTHMKMLHQATGLVQAQKIARPVQTQQTPPQQTTKPAQVQQIPPQQTTKPAQTQQIPPQQTTKPAQVQQIPPQQPTKPAQVQQIPMQQTTGLVQVQQIARPAQTQQTPPQQTTRPAQAQQTLPRKQPQLLQKPPIQQAPRKPPPQELQQKLKQQSQKAAPAQQQRATPAQSQNSDVEKSSGTQKSGSLSSQDESSNTGSGCSDVSLPHMSAVMHAGDTRDLDALLQYIEGPARHVDRGKKKAKKQRQKAKKTEEKLGSDYSQLKAEYARLKFEAEAQRVAHHSAKRRCDETRKALQVMTAQSAPSKSRKKQNKLNPVQKQQIQVLAEQVGELTALMTTTAKELQTAECQVTECALKLRLCEREINEARAMQGKKTPTKMSPEDLKRYQSESKEELTEKKLLQSENGKVSHEEFGDQLSRQEWLLMQKEAQHDPMQGRIEQELMNRLRIDEEKLMKQRQNEAIAKADRAKAGTAVGDSDRGWSSAGSVSSTGADRGGSSPASSCSGAGGAVLVRRAGAHVTLSIPGHEETPLGQLVGNNRHLIIAKHLEEEEKAQIALAQKAEPPRKTQTWEQALAHINQVAKGGKDKKKQKQPTPPPAKPDPPKQEIKPPPVAEPEPEAPAPTLSKKQRKKIAQKQAEEDERIMQEQLQKEEAKSKKAKKVENVERVEKIEKVEKLEKVENIEKVEKVAKPEKVVKVEKAAKIERVEKVERFEKASPAPVAKFEPLTKKAEKKLEQAKRAEQAKTKKEAKRERKLEKKAEKKEEKKAKERENKSEKNAQAAAKQAKPHPPPPMTKKERKREQQLLQKQHEKEKTPVNIHPHTTIEVVNKKNASADAEKPASCSIMEQLSCGIQVSELRLPPGITLTRVQPSEKREPPAIKSVPLWKANQLTATPTPVARPTPVINADPSMMMFSTAHPELPPKPIIIAEPAAVGKSKKAKKKAKKAAAAADTDKPAATKMVTLRNPMFHPNLPPVQISSSPPAQAKKPEQIKLPDPIPMPPNACQATITPTSNGMYTIRNPLMSMMHQQTMMGVRNTTPPFTQPQYYPNPAYPPGNYILETHSPKPDDYQNRIMNLASFTQTNDEGYSLFKTTDNQQRSFLTAYTEESPKPVVSPNPIGTRPEPRAFDSDSLFANASRPEPIGTPLKHEDREYTGLYTPFGVENPLFRNALFTDKMDAKEEVLANGDLPYFQRLRVGSKLNNEVTIHHVTESKFYRQEPSHQPLEEVPTDDSLFSRPLAHTWAEPMFPAHAPANPGVKQVMSLEPGGSPPVADEPRFGPVGTRPLKDAELGMYLPDAQNLSSLEACEREVESFKRYEWYFNPPEHAPKVPLHVADMPGAINHTHN